MALTLAEAKTTQTQPGFNLATAANAATLPAPTTPAITSTPTTQMANSTTPVNTSQPSPQTVNATPYTQPTQDNTGLIGTRASQINPGTTEYFNTQTQQGFANPQQLSTFVNQQGGNTNAQNVFDALKGSFSKLMASNTPAPQSQGEAKSLIDANTQAIQNNPLLGVQNLLAQTPEYKKMVTDVSKITSSLEQQKSGVETYQDFLKQYNIPGMDEKLLNWQKIIDGTEDDIRKEVQAVSGMATESQVLALAGARNKSLIKNYNNLLSAKQMAMEQINQLSTLAGQDREYAMQAANMQLGIDEKMLGMQEKMINSAQETYNNIVKNIGYKGLYQALQNDPSALSLAEKTLGLGEGGLAQLVGIRKETELKDYPTSYQEYLLAKKEGYKGTYNDYQTMDANRKAVRSTTVNYLGGGTNGTGNTVVDSWVNLISSGQATLDSVPTQGNLRNAVATAIQQSGIQLPNAGTDAQNTAAGYADRVKQSGDILNTLENDIKNTSFLSFEAQMRLPSAFQSGTIRQYDQAARNFINAVLRRESGAVISPSEFDNAYKQYLPKPGDDSKTLEQKKNNRETVYNTLVRSSGPVLLNNSTTTKVADPLGIR